MKTTSDDERWVCQFCNTHFKSVRALKRHRKNNLWQGYAIKRKLNNKIKCKYCKKEFDSVQAFKAHWDDEHASHLAETSFLIPRKKEKGNWITRPMEVELIKHNLRSDSAFAALRSDFTVNELVIEEFDHGIRDEAMTVVEIVGIPGSGKSLFALSLARILQMKWLEKILELYKKKVIHDVYTPKIYVGFDLEDTLGYLRDARMGDTIIQDEDPEMMGAHSGSSKSQIENIMKIMRKACINFIFVSPISTPYINMPNMVFEVIAKNIKLRQTKAALYDRKYHAVGWTVMKILDADDELLVGYNAMKDANIDRIKEAGGRRSINVSEEQILDDIRRLIAYLKKIKYNFNKRRHTLVDLVEYAGMAKVEGDTAYQKFIARQALDVIDARIPDLIENSDSGDFKIDRKYLFLKEEEHDDIAFLDLIFKSTGEALKSIGARSIKKPGENILKNFKDHHAKAWYNYYYHGLPYDSVGNMFNVTGQMIANTYKEGGYNAIFQTEIQGECAEIALGKKYFRDYNNIGGFGKPDLVHKHDTNDWIEVKCFQRLSEKLENLISKFEYEFVDQGGTLRLALITYKKKECTIRIYRVVLNPDYKTVDEIKQELSDEKSTEIGIIDDEVDIFEFDE